MNRLLYWIQPMQKSKDFLLDFTEDFIRDFQKDTTGALFDWNIAKADEFSRISIETLITDPYFLGFKDKVYDGVLEDIIDLFEERKRRQINLAIFLEGIGCLNPDNSWLWTDGGLTLLKDINSNTHTSTKDGIKEIIGFKDEEKDTFRIKTALGFEIEGGENHPFYSIISGSPNLKADFNEMKDLKVGDYLGIKLNNNFFGKVHLDNDLAWVLGYLIGDGNIANSIAISAHKDDIILLERFKSITEKHFNCSFRQHFDTRHPDTVHVHVNKKNNLVDFLKKEEVYGKYSYNKSVPLSVLKGDKETWKYFIQGYFDADGSCNKPGQVRISSMSKLLLQQVQLALLNFGILSILGLKKTSCNGKKGITNRLKINGHFGNKFIDDIGFFLERKNNKSTKEFNTNLDLIPYHQDFLYLVWRSSGLTQEGFKTVVNPSYNQFISKDKLIRFLDTYKGTTDRENYSYLNYLSKVNIVWVEITDFEYCGKMILRDISVDTDNNYVSNGFLSHNSGKTTKASIIEWLIWFEVTMCQPNPQEYFDLAPNSVIALINLNRTEKQAKRVTFTEVWNRFQSPFNKDYFPPSERYTTEIRIPRNNTTIFPGTSSALSALGYNLYGGVIDEAAFLEVVDDSSKTFDGRFDAAEEMYHAIMNRMVSRFLRKGHLPGLLCMISSPNFPDDFIHRQITFAEKLLKESVDKKIPNNSGVFWRRRPTWEAKGKKFFPEKESFYIDTTNAEIMDDFKVQKFLDLVPETNFPLSIDGDSLFKIAQFLEIEEE